MKTRKYAIVLTAFVLSMLLVVASQGAGESGIVGSWLGVLEVSGARLRVVFNIDRYPDGSLAASVDSPDQGATGIPVESVSFVEGRLVIVVTAVGGRFEGNANDDVTEVKGVWFQAGQEFPMVLEPTDQSETRRPQDPTETISYTSENVLFENENAGIQLAGTLTKPASEGPFAAVLLVSGSGPQDRDEAIMGHRPFLVLADHLTRRGIAVLRYDDRGVGKSGGDFATSTTRDFAGDAQAGIEFLRNQEGIDPERIGILGHSEGGLVSGMVASESSNIAFVVLMASPGIRGDQLILMQGRLLATVAGRPDEVIERNEEIQAKLFSIVRNEKDGDKRRVQLRELITNSARDLSEAEKQQIGNLDAYIENQIAAVDSDWFRLFISYDPAPDLSKIRCPVLAINGELDLQVPAKENLAAIEKALTEGRNNNFRVVEFPGLNHLFQPATTGEITEYATIETTISTDVLGLIAGWITKVTTP